MKRNSFQNVSARCCLRSATFALLAGAVLSTGCGAPGPSPGERPRLNVLLISVDTLRADHLGCYGYDRETSPAIDALAGRGTRFTRAFTPASWTLPAHMSIMTSQYPHVHGVDRQQFSLPAEAKTLAEVLSAAGYDTAAFVSWFYVSRRYSFDQGVNRFEEFLPEAHDLDLSVRGEVVVDAAVDWLATAGGERPFFLFVHLFDPHMNYDPPPPYDTLFDPDYAGSIDGRYDTLKPFIKGLQRAPATLGARDLRHVVALYDGEIRYTDGLVARLLDAQQARGLAEDTLVVLTSDHGEEFAEHGSMEGHQWTLYDEVTRVPLVLVHPRLRLPSTLDAMVETLDIAPTLLEWLELEAPASFQGRSLAPLLRGQAQAFDRVAFSEIRRFNLKWAVRDERYKLILTSGPRHNALGVPVRRGFELYDLLEDPGETRNVFSRRSPAAHRLGARLNRFIESRGPVDAPEDRPDVVFGEEELEKLRSLGYVQ